MKRKAIEKYVVENYAKLPKSNFDDVECVVVVEKNNDDQGYGHHSYSGIGITAEGRVLECSSGGCSCSGSVSADEVSEDLSSVNWKEVEFEKLAVDFRTYE